MSAVFAFALALSVVAGVLLGLLGGGGSIVMVPILHYVLGMDAHGAVGTSLLVVGSASAVALGLYARAGQVHWRAGAWFGAAGMVGSYAAGRAAKLVPEAALLTLFGAMMLVTAVAMLRRRPGAGDEPASFDAARAIPALRIAGIGLLVGALTGLVGVGGGFLIVPALTLLAGLPMRLAVGTSLMVITLQALAAYAGYAVHAPPAVGQALPIVAATTLGSLGGVRLSTRLKPDRLRVFFAVFVLAMALLVLGDQALKLASVKPPL